MQISDFAARTGFSEDTLRYYEKIGLIGPVLRDSAGHRVYRDTDLRWAEFLGRLKATGMSIAGMRTYARARAVGDATTPARHAQLVAHRAEVAARIAELQDCLSVLDTKIATYAAAMSDAKGPTHDTDDDAGNAGGTRTAAAR